MSTEPSCHFGHLLQVSKKIYLKKKKVNRKVLGMPQSQTAANPRHQEEEKKDKNIHARNKQMYEMYKDQLPLPQAR